jgi:RNA polymerase sigma factor (sigma-70 family)
MASEMKNRLSNTAEEDHVIIGKLKAGDEDTLRSLYKGYAPMVSSFMIGRHPEFIKEVLQISLIEFWQNVRKDEFKLTSKLSTYFYSIAHNQFLRLLAQQKRVLVTDSALEHKETESNTAYQGEAQDILSSKIKSAINCISPCCRKVLLLYYFDELSMDQVAREMGYANIDTAKTKKYKCMQILKKHIEESNTSASLQQLLSSVITN